jgi:hypothetical protein
VEVEIDPAEALLPVSRVDVVDGHIAIPDGGPGDRSVLETEEPAGYLEQPGAHT